MSIIGKLSLGKAVAGAVSVLGFAFSAASVYYAKFPQKVSGQLSVPYAVMSSNDWKRFSIILDNAGDTLIRINGVSLHYDSEARRAECALAIPVERAALPGLSQSVFEFKTEECTDFPKPINSDYSAVYTTNEAKKKAGFPLSCFVTVTYTEAGVSKVTRSPAARYACADPSATQVFSVYRVDKEETIISNENGLILVRRGKIAQGGDIISGVKVEYKMASDNLH